jgi:S1-C subfamily serine protease
MAKKKAKHQHQHHHTHPKPPSQYLWLMEAILVTLGIFAVLSVLLILFLAATNHRKAQQAVQFVTGITAVNNVTNDLKKVHSTIGFELTINDQIQEAEGIVIDNNGSKTVKSGQDVFSSNSYSTVNVYKKSSQNSLTNSKIDTAKASYLSMTAFTKKNATDDLKAKYGQDLTDLNLAAKYFAPVSDQNKTYTLNSTEEVSIGGYKYTKNIYTITNNQSLKYTTKQTDYITVQNSRPYKITVYENAGTLAEDVPQLTSIIETVKYYPSESGAILTKVNHQSKSYGTGNNLYPLVITAEAATQKLISKDTAIQGVAKNEPAVVKIATIYCAKFDIMYKNVSQLFDAACAGGTGSGFILNDQGHVGTNGHVVTFNPIDTLYFGIEIGNLNVIRSYLDYLVKIGYLSASDSNIVYSAIASGDSATLTELYQTLSDVPISSYKVTAEEYNYAVQLGNESIKFFPTDDSLFNYSDNIVEAKFVDQNYETTDFLQNKGFTKSDVAILKIVAKKDYPFVNLGNIESISQGSPLTVIGFPGIADKNGLVDTKSNPPTSTKGQVSAIVDAAGAQGYKLIQTDVGIAHGNSGGPGFNNDGQVVGIATYAISTTDNNGTNVNYLRSVNDLVALAKKNNIVLPDKATGSQQAWEDGLSKFSKAYYSAAISQFAKVKALYPENRLVNEFIAKAEAEKKAGKEAIAPEIYILIGAAVLVVIIIPGLILLVVVKRHHKRRDIHQAFIQQQGTVPTQMQPVQAPQPQTIVQPQPNPTAAQAPPQNTSQGQNDNGGTPPNNTISQ